ncbi:helix-turn-helix domain-containing protein [Emcibacteraceae bacterium]|jgi:transcriptional regulator with XRE-family HTH domain|uniref:helix-turn-helix domain-containing protein n=1 Tax=Pseudemcibacter sp. TaxID=2943293 RepID=UPI0023181B2D|nr:helix-turn-helix transcriptional regulator [Kordiimonadaceae bacterium]MDA7569163.1 helix-turn-helix domain-containing protein [Emcibacteraceae bacterium]MDA9771616.1 helix-turn-helix domain-containing protein [Emcibacteraceae bacterium]MDG1021804.1 helix-turn-helix domain-containing protein [Emcibacteraceae bacterium]MDG1726290.1 helix-turn-helix domain-containing protein [Emcibacteraceae bacterium]
MSMVKSSPDPVDIHVGARVRLRRTLLGMSQEKLGKALGLTFQQVQKYERGANRIGSSRLFQLSKILDVPVSFFFDEMTTDTTQKADGMAEGNKQVFEVDKLSRRETLELVRAYYKITDPSVRKKIFEMVKAVGSSAIGSDES